MDESNAGRAHHHAPNTVTDALDILHGLGYTADFELDGDVLHSTRAMHRARCTKRSSSTCSGSRGPAIQATR